MGTSPQQWVSVTVAARRLGLSYDRVRALLYDHKLKGTRSGDGTYGRLLIDVADLERLIRARRPRAV